VTSLARKEKIELGIIQAAKKKMEGHLLPPIPSLQEIISSAYFVSFLKYRAARILTIRPDRS
jgi:hypothetical protein